MMEKSPLRIGIWLPYGPNAAIRGEGLMRLLTLITRGFSVERHRFVFFCPTWLRKDLVDEIADYPPELRPLFSVQSVWSPFSVVTLFIFWSRMRQERRKESIIKAYGPFSRHSLRLARRHLSARVVRLALRLLSLRTFIPLAAGAAVLVVIALWLIVPAISQWARDVYLAASMLDIPRVVSIAVRREVLLGLAAVAALAIAIKLLGGRVLSLARAMWPGTWLRPIVVGLRLRRDLFYMNFERNEFRRMAEHANRVAEVDVWFTTHAAQESARYLAKPVVSLFADFVFFDCPSGMDPRILRRLRQRSKRLVGRADAIVVLSNYVRDRQLLKYFPSARSKPIHVIPHAMIDYRADCPEMAALEPLFAAGFTQREVAGEMLRTLVQKRLHKRIRRLGPAAADAETLALRYLDGFPFESVTYILCSTQNRAYKNVLTVVRAVAALNRKQGRNLKLLMTGHLDFEAPWDQIAGEIRNEQLMLDVISIPRVPRLAHAALFQGAALVVHPSFFEAAFPWSFSEAVSMGTPALLCNVEMTTEGLDVSELEDFLFDPYSVSDLMRKMEWALANRDALLRHQRRLYERAATGRSWQKVGSEYADVFESVARSRRERA
jgi:hypothetical protein